MQRLVEQPVGDGDVLHRSASLGRAHYRLAVYQHFSDEEDESVPAHLEVEGRVTALDDLKADRELAESVVVEAHVDELVDW